MLGRKLNSPWLLALALALAASPLAVQAAQDDPFAGGDPAAAADQPAAESGTEANDNAIPGGDSGSAGTAAPAQSDDASDPFAGGDAAETPAGTSTNDTLEDEYGFDPAEEFASEQEASERDPWEGFNRAVFRFNDTADRWFLKPLATTYRQVTPIFMQYGVSNFFGNLREVTTSINSVLQWKWDDAGNGAGRFLINSTVGVVGLFDVAQHVGLEETDGEDFGQTLAVWGVPSGPYLVLPLLGPSTVRGVPGQAVDWYTNPLTHIDHDQTRYAFKFTDLVQTRASLLKTEALLQGDRYILLRDAYLQRRNYLIKDGDVSDDFGSEEASFGGGEAANEGDDDPFGGGAAEPAANPAGDDTADQESDTARDSDAASEPDVFDY